MTGLIETETIGHQIVKQKVVISAARSLSRFVDIRSQHSDRLTAGCVSPAFTVETDTV
jgi:hypothetical protein